MKKLSIDSINIGLMFLALIPALLFPFELFLFVYAFLGPLHYLTEINWLHKKNYFTNHKNDYLLIVAITLLAGFLVVTKSHYKVINPLLMFTVFVATFAMVFFTNYRKKLLFTLICIVAGIGLFYLFGTHFKMFFSNLLPSIIHVFIFTGLFIVLGALKSNSKLGKISAVVFVLCATVALFAPPDLGLTSVNEYIYNSYGSFRGLNKVLIDFFSFMHSEDARISMQAPPGLNENDMSVFFSGTGIKIMRFIAFAYTYHYLNWFSKTSVIQWHNTKTINLVAIGFIWVLSVILYVVNYKTGLQWLYILSLAHVLLELPLNHRSVLDIKKHISLKLSK